MRGAHAMRSGMVLAVALLVGCGGGSAEDDLTEEGSNLGEDRLRPMTLTWKPVAGLDGAVDDLTYATAEEADCTSKPRMLSVHITPPTKSARATEIIGSFELEVCNRAAANLTRVAWYVGKAEAPILRATKAFPIYQGTSMLPPSNLVVAWEENDFSCRAVDGLGMQNHVVCQGTGPAREAFNRILSQAASDFEHVD